MNLKEADNILIGDSQVVAIYIGDELVWTINQS